MSNVLVFPNLRPIPTMQSCVLDEAQILAYAERHALQSPERVAALSASLLLVNKTVLHLHELIKAIKLEVGASQADVSPTAALQDDPGART